MTRLPKEIAENILAELKNAGRDDILRLSYHAALPVALDADFVHLLRINFFIDILNPPAFTVEAVLLWSPLW